MNLSVNCADSIQASDKKCDCPKPCNQTIYEPSLSQAALSVLSVDNILSENIEQLRHKYHAAIEAHQRVNEKVGRSSAVELFRVTLSP